MYLSCSECGLKKFEDKEFDESDPERTKCPDCGKEVVLPEACCGLCVHSSELSDGYLICCINSTVEKLNTVPFNANSSECQNYEAFDGFFGDDFEGELDGMINELDEAEEGSKSTEDAENEFDGAFDSL